MVLLQFSWLISAAPWRDTTNSEQLVKGITVMMKQIQGCEEPEKRSFLRIIAIVQIIFLFWKKKNHWQFLSHFLRFLQTFSVQWSTERCQDKWKFCYWTAAVAISGSDNREQGVFVKRHATMLLYPSDTASFRPQSTAPSPCPWAFNSLSPPQLWTNELTGQYQHGIPLKSQHLHSSCWWNHLGRTKWKQMGSRNNCNIPFSASVKRCHHMTPHHKVVSEWYYTGRIALCRNWNSNSL